jgi:ATP-dependent DNA helicase RecG
MDLKTPLSKIPGIGPNFARRLQRLYLYTVSDLIHHYPFRYDDLSLVTSALEAKIGEKVTLQGEIWSIKNIHTRSRKVLTQAIFNDGTSPIELTWFNSPWLTKQLVTGDRVQISGKLGKYKNKLSIVAPIWEKTSEFQPLPTLHTGRLVPVYPETFGVTSRWIRTKIAAILDEATKSVVDPIPDNIKEDMLSLETALKKIHFPDNYQDVEKARERLGFDELFFIQLSTLKTRQDWRKKDAVATFEVTTPTLNKFIKSLPFQLTNAQQKVTDEIISDLQRGVAMNRLIQGEVGSGKTVVAAVIVYLAHLNGYKTLFMAPTEILAFQHHSTLSNLLKPFGIEVGIYTGSKKKAESAHIIVGTHALLSKKMAIGDVGLVIVDEQQRFGVDQRSVLRARAKVPHFLSMTATPIPRTVALTLYGDLDISVIDELPKGRKTVKTHLVPAKKRADAYQFIDKKVALGDQVYIITPLIEESETLTTVKAAKVEFENLKNIFPNRRIGLLHGRLKSKEKEQVLNDFKNHLLDILVSTSVVEVGVDVTNATIMVIEGAERFGLAQLHQLRGRVGRGEKESFCFLFTGSSEDQDASRLKSLETTYNGLKLAELDLKIRGSGEIFGKKQSGRFELKIATFHDLGLIEKTRNAAKKILEDNPTLDKYPLYQAQLQNSGNVMPD